MWLFSCYSKHEELYLSVNYHTEGFGYCETEKMQLYFVRVKEETSLFVWKMKEGRMLMTLQNFSPITITKKVDIIVVQ